MIVLMGVTLVVVAILGIAGFAYLSSQNALIREQIAALARQDELSSQYQLAGAPDMGAASGSSQLATVSTSDRAIGQQEAASSQTGQQTQGLMAGYDSFTNATGGYAFKYPKEWDAFVNSYAKSNSLFGPNASDKSAMGGVEVTPFSGDLNDWVKYLEANVEIRIIDQEFVQIAGLRAIRATTEGMNRRSTSVYLLNGGKVYNIYMRTTGPEDLEKFNQLANSFNWVK